MNVTDDQLVSMVVQTLAEIREYYTLLDEKQMLFQDLVREAIRRGLNDELTLVMERDGG